MNTPVERKGTTARATYYSSVLVVVAAMSMPSLAKASSSVNVTDHYLGEDCVDVTWEHNNWEANKWRVCWKEADDFWSGICNTNNASVSASSHLHSYSAPVCGLDADKEYKFHVEAYRPTGTITMGNWKNVGNDTYDIPDYYCGNGVCESFHAFPDETEANCSQDCLEPMACNQNADWWDGSDPAGNWDGYGCKLYTPNAAWIPFTWSNNYYINGEMTDNCPAGRFDGEDCYLRPVSPGGYISGRTFYAPTVGGMAPLCSSDWNWNGFTCWWTAPAGHRAFENAGKWYITTEAYCPIGYFDGAIGDDGPHCFVGSAPAGTSAELHNENFYFMENSKSSRSR